MPLPMQHYFRISGIPAKWTAVSVVGALKSLEPTIIDDHQNPHLSLYPACSGFTQTGLLKLENCIGLLETTKLNNIRLELEVKEESAYVHIDGHFCGLTPLNTPDNEYIVE
jgi:hypothetical protein